MAIDRRRFLRLAGAAAAPLVARPAFGRQQAARAADSDNPVVVVGAGLAGLRAADVLRKAGRRVVVLEARDSPGGRAYTIRTPFDSGLHAEAGPIRIAGSHQTVLQLVREFGLTLVPFDSSNGSELVTIGDVSVRTGALRRTPLPLDLKPNEKGLSQGALLDRYVGELPRDLADLTPGAAAWARWEAYDGVAWPQWLRSRGASEGAVKLMTIGGDSRELSALYVLRQLALLRGTKTFFKIQGGMDLLPRAMASALGDFVQYNAPVVRVDQTSDPVRVDYVENDQVLSLYAGRVVFAVPFSTLRRIEILPSFPRERQRVIDALPYFPATRFLLQSRTRFWHRSGLSGYARTDRPMEIWDCTYDQPGTPGILGATVGGAIGRQMMSMSPEVSVRFGQKLVAEALPDIQSEFQQGIAHQWALERWSQGAFAVFHPGQMASMMPGISTPEGRAHFAGEHTSSWMGWMEGALQSGDRVAREILS